MSSRALVAIPKIWFRMSWYHFCCWNLKKKQLRREKIYSVYTSRSITKGKATQKPEAHPKSIIESNKMYRPAMLNSHFFFLIQLKAYPSLKGAAQFYTGSSILIKVIKTIPNRHAHKPTWYRQPLTETLFPGKSSLGQVDKTNHPV